MKIEMAESLFYSWLRHAKGCQMVQTNWKVSPSWTISNEFVIEQMFNELKDYFMKTYNYKVFNKNSLSQFIKQGECDVLGINVNCGVNQYYAVDVAFHSDGLNYGSYEKTIYKVISKCIRTAFCLYGFFEASEAEIVFASPKINPRELTGIIPLIQFINDYFTKKGFSYKFRLIYGSDFELNVINPILIASDNVADTNELFIRSYQMLKLFENYSKTSKPTKNTKNGTMNTTQTANVISELKVGYIAHNILKDVLESGKVSADEVALMQEENYCKETFGLQYPLLVLDGNAFDKKRYYAKPVTIDDEKYYLCSQWFETTSNDDKSLLIKWLAKYNIQI